MKPFRCIIGSHSWATESSYYTSNIVFCQRCGKSDTDPTTVALYLREESLWKQAEAQGMIPSEAAAFVRSNLRGDGGHVA